MTTRCPVRQVSSTGRGVPDINLPVVRVNREHHSFGSQAKRYARRIALPAPKTAASMPGPEARGCGEDPCMREPGHRASLQYYWSA
jgi:hypothetical protein